MSTFDPGRPQPDEHLPYYSRYIDLVPDGNIVEILAAQRQATQAALASLTAEQAAFRPKPADWNIVQVVRHLADGERMFTYRAMRFARNDATPLSSFDPDVIMAGSDFEQRSLADELADWEAVRGATLTLFRGLSKGAWLRRGLASNNVVSVRASAYIVAGHELHHLADFRQRYGLVG